MAEKGGLSQRYKEERNMGYMKRVLAAVLAAMMLVPTVAVSAAAPSPERKAITSVSAKANNKTYTGKTQTLTVTLKDGNTTLKKGTDYTIASVKKKNAGTYKVTVTGIGRYSGTRIVNVKINKASAKLTTKAKSSYSYKASSLKKKSRTIIIGAKRKSKGKVTYSVSAKKSLKKYISVSKSGKVTLKRNAKKGTYTVTVKVAGSSNYKSATKKITIKVK